MFLQDIRNYRVQQLEDSGLEPIFPVWEIPTAQLGRDLIAAGVKAKLTCVDTSKLATSFVGRDYDLALLADLPPEVDPCGENGEFHTFVYDAPVFRWPIPVQVGERVEREGFVFADLLPAAQLAQTTPSPAAAVKRHNRRFLTPVPHSVILPSDP